MLIYENDLLVVDELFYDPRYTTCSIIRIGNDYFMVRNQAQKPIKECDLRPFKAKIATKSNKAVQVRVPIEEAIPLEQKLRKKGIEASNGSPGRVNIRTEWGGYRPGAGRPATGRRKRTYYVTDEEYEKLKEYLQSLR